MLGFAASAVLDPARVRELAARAVEVARASAALPGEPVRLAPAEPAVAASTPVTRDPFAVPLAERMELLLAASDAQRSVAGLARQATSTCGGGAPCSGPPKGPGSTSS